ncbi:putative mitochondrial protein AtMg00310 [Apium graveolens]|uniref:putative mitochondrial protein AtMg00310 n=1 Tax=Apium graveolens TaxID=4045 RepID=UPI003D79AAB7
MLNKFWWNSGSTERRGINWLSWDGMSMSYSKGGLGFTSLYGFNIALLGNLCWNLLNKPLFLVARLNKARYYHNDHQLKATVKPCSIFIWTGILSAKNTLAGGFRWVLGDGVVIDVCQDPWLRGKWDFKVDQNHTYEGDNTSISSLFMAGEKA